MEHILFANSLDAIRDIKMSVLGMLQSIRGNEGDSNHYNARPYVVKYDSILNMAGRESQIKGPIGAKIHKGQWRQSGWETRLTGCLRMRNRLQIRFYTCYHI